MAVERVGARETLVVGDRLDTDLAGARAGGYIGLHVLTGVNSARDDVLAIPGERPHLIGADLRSLLVAHPEPQQGGDGWWTVPGASARVSTAPSRSARDAVERRGPGRRGARGVRGGVGGGRRRRARSTASVPSWPRRSPDRR